MEKPRKVLYIATTFRLIGIDLDALEGPSRSYRRGTTRYKEPPLFCDLNYYQNGLPLAMGVFHYADDEENSGIYLVGGEIIEDEKDFCRRGIRAKSTNISKTIYKFDPYTVPLLAIPEPVGAMLAPKARPLVETLTDGRRYVLGFHPLFYEKQARYRAALFEMFTIAPRSSSPLDSSGYASSSSSSVLSTKIIDDDSILSRCYFSELVPVCFVLGNRIFLVLEPQVGPIVVCFDADQGQWMLDLNVWDIVKSFQCVSGYLPSGGKSVAIPQFGYDTDSVAQDHYYVFLFYVDLEHEIRFYAAIMREWGTLLCCQEISEEIFPTDRFPSNLLFARCFFLNAQDGRYYAVVTGLDADHPDTCSVICIAEFSLTKLSITDRMVEEDIWADGCSPPKNTKFLHVSSVKNYICSTFNNEMEEDIYGVFIL